ncbi:MAG: MFS transporter [Armatimonadetes bacterium]|nr:MFS transporter [Armatimonadota bacterium]
MAHPHSVPLDSPHAGLRRDWYLFGGLTFCFAVGFAIYAGIFQNFIREELAVDPRQLGGLESLREVPGLLTAFLAGSLVALAETRLSGFAIAFCALGIAATGLAWGYWPLVAISVFWSIGAHLWFAVSPAIVMALSKGEESGRHLGRMAGIGSSGTLVALAATALLLRWQKAALPGAKVPYTALFVVAGCLMLVAAGACLRISAHGSSTAARARLVFRREYRLYYLLIFLEGCRRQISGTFAPFVLIVVFGTRVETMLSLAFANALLSMLFSPLAGKWIDRRGERAVLTLYYVLLVLVFLGYGLLRSVSLLYALYLADSVLFCLALGITTYLNGIVRPGDLTPSLAMGTTMNHVAAVVVPVTGGILWKTMDNYRLPFWIGIGVALVSLWAARHVPRREGMTGSSSVGPASGHLAREGAGEAHVNAGAEGDRG